MAKTKTNAVDATVTKKTSKDVKALKKAAAAPPVVVVAAEKKVFFFCPDRSIPYGHESIR